MLNPFVYIKNRVRDAILTGFAEGLAALDADGGPVEVALPDALRMRLLPATETPATVEETDAPKRRKAVAS